MDEYKNGLSDKIEPEQKRNADAPQNFAQFSPMQQERIVTQIHTLGAKQAMRRFEASLKDNDSGRVETL